MKSLWIFMAFAVWSASYPCIAQEIFPATGRFGIEVDHARFYGDSTQNYVEIYYGLLERTISYRIDSNRMVGAVNMRLEVWADTGVVFRREWYVPRVMEDSARLALGQRMVGKTSVGLHPGDYTLTFSAHDAQEPSRRDSITFSLPIMLYPTETEALSDIELCSSIRSSSDQQSLFYKNTLEVIPNPGRLFGTGLANVFYYTEIYNLLREDEKADVIVRAVVLDAAGNEVLSQERAKPRKFQSSVEVGTMNVSTLRSGTYTLRISVLDQVREPLTSAMKKFFIYKPGTTVDTSMAAMFGHPAGDGYAEMSDSMLDREFDQLRYIVSNPEKAQYEKLREPDAKRRFLAEFWQRRDPDPSTPMNELKEEYRRRLDYVHRGYSVGFREGWKTDRGRVYLVYGPSDEIERFPNTSQSLPYEIWHYHNIQGGVIFVFVDRTGFGDYNLVHSTHRDELRDDQWYQEYAQKIR